MPEIGVNNEPLLDRRIFGYDGTDYRVVKLDTDGNLVAAIKASQQIEVVQDTPADLNATVNLGGANEFGIVEENVSNTDLGAGGQSLNGTAVPTGQIWRITALAVLFASASINHVLVSASGVAGSLSILDSTALVTGVWYPLNVEIFMQQTDYLLAYFYNCTAGDDGYLRYVGERIK